MDLSKMRQWLLPGSLAVNAFLAGMLATHALHEGPPPHGGPPSPAQIVEEMAATLPPADGRILRDAIAPHLGELEASDQANRDVPHRLQVILNREPFDQAAFQAQLRQSGMNMQILANVLPQTIARMSPEGRRALAKWHPRPPPPR